MVVFAIREQEVLSPGDLKMIQSIAKCPGKDGVVYASSYKAVRDGAGSRVLGSEL